MAIITAIEGSTHGIIHQTDTTSLDTRGICEGTYPEDVSIPLHAAWLETFQDPGGWLFFFLFIIFFWWWEHTDLFHLAQDMGSSQNCEISARRDHATQQQGTCS